MNGLGSMIRVLREHRQLYLRQVASAIDIDQALLSKIERGERRATKEQVLALANFYKIAKHKLLAIWLGEKIAYEIKDEENAIDALKIAEETLEYLNGKKIQENNV
ncbi:MAG: helix-turn-helix transcriptional regulator [Weeksellaceae bacterium]|jgi:transcriptional regulator with XRE-family HTH domain|nr:helix-turn-helix transcriptional regulator [Weeksellaceae bacterium]MDX9697687.1 helix-turn-helix transcriptional regulator [Bacteroidales bacterium]